MTDTNGEPTVMETLGQSPLTEADPKSLEVLLTDRLKVIFNTMPSKLNYEDKKAVVQYYRSMRGKFLDEEARKLTEGPKPRKSAAAPKSVAAALAQTSQGFD